MKKFEIPAIQVEHFDIEDIVTTSDETSNGNGTMLPDMELP